MVGFCCVVGCDLVVGWCWLDCLGRLVYGFVCGCVVLCVEV